MGKGSPDNKALFFVIVPSRLKTVEAVVPAPEPSIAKAVTEI